VTLGDGTLHWHNLGGAPQVYDLALGKRRPATVADVQRSARLLDALENVTTVTPFFTPQDVPGEQMAAAMYRHTIANTSKPVHGPGVGSPAEVSAIVRMAEVVGSPGELLTLSISPVSPLNFPDPIVAAMIETARQGIPFIPLPCPTAAATAPLALAGALTQQNAEILASIVLAQLVQPGLPMIYCGRLAVMDLRSGLSVWGGVELGLVSAATVQIGHYYGLPVNVYGFCTNAHTHDIQNGYERALNAAIPALAGADERSGVGELEAGLSGCYAQMVIDNEIISGIRRLCRGLAVDVDSLAVAAIAAAMDGPGNFLGLPHTVRYLRAGEVFTPRLAERQSWEAWERGDRQGILERAAAEAERLLSAHRPAPLSASQEKELASLLKA
jgi:trimethylamine--corrinoid protein Co-methyltransferase